MSNQHIQLKDTLTEKSLFLPQHSLPHSTERAPMARRFQASPSPYYDHAHSHAIGLSGNLGVCRFVLGPVLDQWGDIKVRMSLTLK